MKIVELRGKFDLKDPHSNMDYVLELGSLLSEAPEAEKIHVYREICRAHLVDLFKRGLPNAGKEGTVRIGDTPGVPIEVDEEGKSVTVRYRGMKFKYARAELAR